MITGVNVNEITIFKVEIYRRSYCSIGFGLTRGAKQSTCSNDRMVNG